MKKIEKVKKFRRHHNSRIIKTNQTYTIQEIAELLKVHYQTVLRWLKNGLIRIDNHLPCVVHGQDLKDFINEENSKRKHKCAPDELFCCKCQRPRRSLNNLVCIKIFKNKVNLVGNCEKCGTQINKTISPEKVSEYKKIFVIVPVHEEDLIECANIFAITIKNDKEING